MPRQTIPFNGPAYQDISRFMSGQECVNFFLRPYPSTGDGQGFALVGTPGLELWVDLGTSKAVRGMIATDEFLFVVSGNKFFRVGEEGIATEVGSGTIATQGGKVSMATNGLDVTLVDGPNGYVYDLSAGTLTKISDLDFPGGETIVYLSGYYFVNPPGTSQIHQSTINDGTAWPGFFDTAGGNIDDILGMIVSNLDMIIIGSQSTEPWRNVGNATFIAQPVSNAFIEQGTVSGDTLAKAQNAVFWLGKDVNGQGQVFQVLARQPQVISTPAVDYQISLLSDITDAEAFTYEQAGQSFYALNFPTDSRTFVYDIGNRVWHERASTLTNDAGDTQKGRWRVANHSLFDSNHIVGDFDNGKLYKLKLDAFDEDGTDIIGTRVTNILRSNQDDITVNELQILTEPGVGLSTGNAADTNPHILLSWSVDGGFNFSNEVSIPIGKLGAYRNRVITPPLGQGRNWVFKMRMNSKVKRIITGAFADIEVDHG